MTIANFGELFSKVDGLFAQYDKPGSPGAAIGIVHKGELIYKRGYGYAQLEYDVPISPTTVFHIASISKQFACFAIALLEQEGKLSFDDEVKKHLPYVPDFGHKITIRQMMHHTSGLRDQWELVRLAGWRMDDVITQEHVVKMVKYQEDLNFEPGAEHLYSNTGYTLLAEIVKAVTGLTLREFTDKYVFKPLGMNNTHFHDNHEEIVRNRAYSYAPAEGGFRKSVLSYANVGATSLFTTIEDLTKWVLNFDSKQVGGQAVDNMFERYTLNNGETINYLIGGLMANEYRGIKHVGHTGSDAGFRTACIRFPEHDFAVIIFCNLSTMVPSSLVMKVAEIFLGDKMTPVVAEKEEAGEAPLAAAEFGQYSGEYLISHVGVTIEVKQEGDKLVMVMGDQPASDLLPKAKDKFTLESLQVPVTFERNEEGQICKLVMPVYGAPMTANRLSPLALTNSQLADYAGAYYSNELGTTYMLLVSKTGGLTMTHRRHEDIELVATKEDVFEGKKRMGMLTFTREKGQVTGFKLTGSRVRNLRFTKVK